MSTQIILSIQSILDSGLWDNLKLWPTIDLFTSTLSSSSSATPISISSSLSVSMNPESRISAVDINSTDDTVFSNSTKQTPLTISTYSLCSSFPSSGTYYYSLGYNILLLLLVSIISFRIRRHRENYREALFITISGLSSILVWITWITGYLISRDSGSDAFTGFGLQINSLIVFLVMFLPKAKQLIKLSWIHGDGGDSPELDDDEEEEDEDIYCDGDTMRQSLGQTVINGGRANLRGDISGRERRRRQRDRQNANRRHRNGIDPDMGNILCSAEYSGHDSSQSLCAQSFVHLNPNYPLPHRPVYHPFHHQPPATHQTSRQQKSSQHQLYSSNSNLIHFNYYPHHHPHHLYSSSSSPQPIPIIRDSIRSHDIPYQNYQKPSVIKSHNNNSVNSNRFVYTNSLLKSLGDDSFAFYRIPPIQSIYTNKR